MGYRRNPFTIARTGLSNSIRYIKKNSFNFYPLFKELLNESIKQAENGSFKYAEEIIVFADVLQNVHYHSELENLVHILINNRRFDAAKKLIKPSIQVYRSCLVDTSKRQKQPLFIETTERELGSSVKHYDRYIDFKSYIRLLKFMISLNDRGAVKEAEELKEEITLIINKFISEAHTSSQETYLPAFYLAVGHLYRKVKSSSPNSENLKLLSDLYKLNCRLNSRAPGERFKKVKNAIRHICNITGFK